jgi:hypothetical protein
MPSPSSSLASMTLLPTRDQLTPPLINAYGKSAAKIMLRMFTGVISWLGLDSQKASESCFTDMHHWEKQLNFLSFPAATLFAFQLGSET